MPSLIRLLNEEERGRSAPSRSCRKCPRIRNSQEKVGAVDSFAPAHSASGLPVYVAPSRLAPFTRTALAIETRSAPALTHVLPPIRPVGFPIYFARRPGGSIHRCLPTHPSARLGSCNGCGATARLSIVSTWMLTRPDAKPDVTHVRGRTWLRKKCD